MPKGQKVKDYPAPIITRCDFCGGLFKPKLWNSRTCRGCAKAGCPDQSSSDYEKEIAKWLIKKYGPRKRKKP
jgi:hypothetical protein